ncbi:MAG: hypothetical protein IPM02_28040 [Betaproteobacteria bacterium]|nr:hypothetical protein [Betaproteobacteria bacterium]
MRAAPSTGSRFPIEYRDDYFVVDYCSTWLRYLNASNNAQGHVPALDPDVLGRPEDRDGRQLAHRRPWFGYDLAPLLP